MTHDHTPRLPDIFPQEDILVEDEQHRYETFAGDAGDVLPKTEYTLNKAPVDTITEVTGIVDGRTVEFTQGTDYSLEPLVREQTSRFTFFVDDGPYTLDDTPDTGSTVVTDASGDTYTEGVDYEVFNPDGIEADTIQFLDGGSTPDDEEEFTVDFTVTFPDSVIEWDDTERTPDAGSIFYVSYRCESVISRYIDSADEQLTSIEEELEKIVEGKFVDSAEGQELDELGKMFGVLGKRSGRNDTQYRIYLKSVVQSFVSRGTVNGIKLAISAATDVPIEDITIDEDFEDNSYEVVVIPQTPVDGNLLEEVAEIADPSGVEQSLTRFTPEPDEVGIGDSATFTLGESISDDMGVTDANAIFRRQFTDTTEISDTIDINANKFTINIDVVGSNDAVALGPNTHSASDDMSSDDEGVANRAEASDTLNTSDAFAIDPRTFEETDTTGIDDPVATPRGFADEEVETEETLNVEPSDKNAHRWETTSDPNIKTRWSFFEWTELIELARVATDKVSTDDAATVPPKDGETTDSFFSADSVEVRFNVESVSDTAFTDDAVTIPPKDATTADTGGSADAVTNISETFVAWDTQDWNTLEWTIEHN